MSILEINLIFLDKQLLPNLKQLEKVGILSSEKIGKEIIYKNISLFKIAEN